MLKKNNLTKDFVSRMYEEFPKQENSQPNFQK